MNKERRTTSRRNKAALWTALCIIVITTSLLLLSSKYTFIDGKIYTLVPDYNHLDPGSIHCMAFMPSCGYCVDNLHPGKDTLVRNKQCYRAL